MEEVPLLLKDPCALLIQLVLTMPSTIDKGKLSHTEYLPSGLYTFLCGICIVGAQFFCGFCVVAVDGDFN